MSYASMPSFSSILFTVYEKKNIEYFSKIYVAPSTNLIKPFGQKSYETWRTTQ